MKSPALRSLVLALCGLCIGRAADRPLVFDPAHSTVDVAVQATVDSFTGRLSRYELTGSVDAAGRIARAELSFRFRDLLTGKPKRDVAMHEWQRTAQFPDAQFTLNALSPAAGGTWLAQGSFKFHGVAKQVEFPVTVARDGDRYAVDGDAAIDTRDFGLPIIRMMAFLKVDPVVHVRFHFQGKAS